MVRTGDGRETYTIKSRQKNNVSPCGSHPLQQTYGGISISNTRPPKEFQFSDLEIIGELEEAVSSDRSTTEEDSDVNSGVSSEDADSSGDDRAP